MVLRVCIISQFKLHTLSTVSAVMETVVEYEQFYGMQWNAQSFTLFNATTFMITVIELKAKQSINKNTDKWTFTQIKIYADEIYFKIKWFLNTTRQFKTNNFRPKKEQFWFEKSRCKKPDFKSKEFEFKTRERKKNQFYIVMMRIFIWLRPFWLFLLFGVWLACDAYHSFLSLSSCRTQPNKFAQHLSYECALIPTSDRKRQWTVFFLKENIYIHTHTYFVIALSTKTPKKCRCIIFSETISTMFAYKHLLINREKKCIQIECIWYYNEKHFWCGSCNYTNSSIERAYFCAN